MDVATATTGQKRAELRRECGRRSILRNMIDVLEDEGLSAANTERELAETEARIAALSKSIAGDVADGRDTE